MSKAKSTPVRAADALGGLLPDWRISLRARGRSLATIASYLAVGESFTEYLSANGMPNGAATVAREHVEQYSLTCATAAWRRPRWPSTTAPCSSCSSGPPTTAR